MTALSLSHISKSFGLQSVLKDLSFEIGSGELFFLLGPSGCGKTTLLRIIAGLETPDRGEVMFDGTPVTTLAPHLRGIGMVFQQYALWPHMTVFQNVEFGLRMRKRPVAERADAVRDALELVQLGELAHRFPGELSGGQQQRVALARALALKPKIVLLDEPLSNLDSKLRGEVREEIRSLHEKMKITMIYVTHDQEEALSLGTGIAVMNQGRIEQLAAPKDLYRAPVSPFVARFLGFSNFLPGQVIRTSSGEAHFEGLSGKVSLALPATTDLANGPAWCLLKPESLVPVPERQKDTTLSGRVIRKTLQHGIEESLVEIETGTNFTVRTLPTSRDRFRPGETVHLEYQPSDILLYPRDGGPRGS